MNGIDDWPRVPDCFEHGPTMYRLVVVAVLSGIGLLDGGDNDLLEVTFFLCADCARLVETRLRGTGIASPGYRVDDAVLETLP